MGASRVYEPSSIMPQRMAGSNPIQPSSFGPVGADPLGRGRAPRGEDPLMEEQDGRRSVTRQMVRQIRDEDEGRKRDPLGRGRRIKERDGKRGVTKRMMSQIRAQEEARKRAK